MVFNSNLGGKVIEAEKLQLSKAVLLNVLLSFGVHNKFIKLHFLQVQEGGQLWVAIERNSPHKLVEVKEQWSQNAP